MMIAILTGVFLLAFGGFGSHLFKLCLRDEWQFKKLRRLLLCIFSIIPLMALIIALLNSTIGAGLAQVLAVSFWVSVSTIIYLVFLPKLVSILT